MSGTHMASTPLNKIERAHQLYRDGRHGEALGFYTEALALAKNKAQKIALHSNRAACYLKLHDFKKAAEECTSVLELDHKHTGALMLRAQTLVTLKEYQSALFDVNRLMELNPSSEVYQNLQARLKTQLSLAPIPESEAELEEEDEDKDEAETKIDEEEQPEEGEGKEFVVDMTLGRDHKVEHERSTHHEVPAHETKSIKDSIDQHSQGWQTIPKPKGHSHLDYSRWDRVEDDSSDDDDEDDDEDESQPQYRFRVRTVGVQPVK